ncbi:MAG TPA: hypothetical protein VHS05_00040 [Pyrinomonadaceae bacterium]|jgi:uncharacterized small protein (DUF1192 family)|nr:hypothetical protein [Pyrinomonadaceae bacterium]
MADDRIKILEERLTRLEATLAQRPVAGGGGGFTPPGGVIVDSAPWAASQFQFQRPIPSPVVDPAPWPYWGGWGGGWPRPWPTPVVDPGPFPHPVVDPAPWRSHIVDPAVFAQSAAAQLGRFRPVGGDPPPPDLSRLSVQQLEATIHTISAERARLDAMEEMVKKQIEALKKQPG